METDQPTLYERRLAKELAIADRDIEDRVRWSRPVLSVNRKCSISLDLPIINCQPTALCASVCYSCQGTQYFRESVVKSLAVQRMIDRDPERVARKMVDEAEGRVIRIAGSGEILPQHKTLLDYVSAFGSQWWGFTRRVDTHLVLPMLMFSIDRTTPSPVMEYVVESVPVGRRAYLRHSTDPEPPVPVAVTFPVHGSVTPYAELVPLHATDCPVDRGTMSGCWRCERCY